MQPRVLLADQDTPSRGVLTSFLSKAGWRFECAPTVADTVQKLTQGEFDILVADFTIPTMGGIDLLRRIKKEHPHQAVLVVNRTASVQDVVSSIREGATDILLDPVDYESFIHSIERILSSFQNLDTDGKVMYEHLDKEEETFTIPVKALVSIRPMLGIVDRLARAGKIDKIWGLKYQLAFQEALANSVDHGALELVSRWKEEIDETGRDKFSVMKDQRLNDPAFAERKIVITTRADQKSLEITISDPGNGFPLKENAPDRDPNRPLRCYGRGLGIISGTMDEVLFFRNGAEIQMVKYFST